MRTEISWIEGEMEKNEIVVDINKMVVLVNQFYNLCVERDNENRSIMNLFSARTIFESCITILKGIIEPENNTRIKEIDSNGDISIRLETYFENFMAILDMEQKELEKNIKEIKKLIDPLAVSVGVKTYREKLVDYMENLIITPLYNSCNDYNNLTIKLKDQGSLNKEELFTYLDK